MIHDIQTVFKIVQKILSYFLDHFSNPLNG